MPINKFDSKIEDSDLIAAESEIINKKASKSKKYIALKTTNITCNGEFKLVEGEEIPKEINKNFINSLKNSNLIK